VQTGVVGSALIPLLLEDPNSQVWMLMRADSCEHQKKRLEELITFWEMEREQAQDARLRIIPLLGDTDKKKFALSEMNMQKLPTNVPILFIVRV